MEKSKKLTSVFLSVIASIAMAFALTFVATPASTNAAQAAEADLTITSVQELKDFAAEVNGGNGYAGKTVVLDADIDLAGEEWTPIGTNANSFKGTFDGGNHKIQNLVITRGLANEGVNIQSLLTDTVNVMNGGKYSHDSSYENSLLPIRTDYTYIFQFPAYEILPP